ncbi:MAG: dTDP-4-dehydrorhamnose reductase [Dissulfurimicrobium sp.]|uniref:dTDP-4-dehydrorhamnose reductase n=1 Tax=Dissulfurimicrobium TaxID=1769732 RepID=UPI001EDC6247|nr:dTDP-4-dehydrorhamnose reductase [Dissulfurimicrobium hydrothermale]UKL14516.1 dTDP-4-dehydrorhamnose reductase [Dissulfurimicrobium hydrothermale]
MKIIITGKNGQVGWELARTLTTLGDVAALGREAMDLSDPASIRTVISGLRPSIIINAAAYTAVDRAEEEKGLAMAVNGIAPGVMAEEARRLGALLVHYSTDYVFDGTKCGPYTEEDPTNPINTYGKTKLAGEEAVRSSGCNHLIFRTSWVYGTRGANFLLTMLRLLRERNTIKIVDDQKGAPTWSRMIAEVTAQVLSRFVTAGGGFEFPPDHAGLYHLSAGGTTTWYGFACAISNATGRGCACKIMPIPSEGYLCTAKRPKNSIMSNEKLFRAFGIKMPNWDVQFNLCMEGLRAPSQPFHPPAK